MAPGREAGDAAELHTPRSVFETFPWPDRATPEQRERVADACRQLLARRSELCLGAGIGLTKLYNAMDEGAYTRRWPAATASRRQSPRTIATWWSGSPS